MYFATKSQQTQIVIWLIWAMACLLFLVWPEHTLTGDWSLPDLPALPGVVTHEPGNGPLFPWHPRHRWRLWARRRYRALQRAHRRAKQVAHLARLALSGVLTLAKLVDLATSHQIRQHLGALPVLYALLETLQVRHIINRYCPSQAEVDHGTVALVLVLNRLTMPLPLYQVADWLAKTVLVCTLGCPAIKFNDDRLARTLDAIQPHCRDIWQAIAHRALVQAQVDLSLVFYDLTAYTVHGQYTGSRYIDFGFAHNTPLDKRKFKNGLDVVADGDVPLAYSLWSGRTADLATVQENMARLKSFLERHGYSLSGVRIIGDRANLNDELALAYDDHQVRYLAGLQPHKKVHRELLSQVPEVQFYDHPLTSENGPTGYWGMSCPVPFAHEGRQVTHRGLVVLSGPMRTARRRARASQFQALHHSLREVQAKIGQSGYRTVKAVQQRAETQLKRSRVGKLVAVKAYPDESGQVCLRWQVSRYLLWQAMQTDGRYLLVTNDWGLSPQKMLTLYRQKDGVEKRIQISKGEHRISPVYLHKDNRIEAMLLINMLALLAYSLLERQVRQNGLQMTTRRVIDKLQSLDVIETVCWDGSHLLRLVPIDEEQAQLLQILTQILTDLQTPRWSHRQLQTSEILSVSLALPPPVMRPIIS